MRTVGVEEELLLVDDRGRAVAVAPTVLAAAERQSTAAPDVDEPRGAADGSVGPPSATGHESDGAGLEGELQLQQVEIDSTPCLSLVDLQDDLVGRRRQVDELARGVGARVAALATSPLPVAPRTTPHPRYRRMAGLYGLMEREQLTCGCHVHVSVDSPEEGVAALDRIRLWMPVLVAMATNSPFWQGQDTGYAGYRTQVWARWPSAGPADLHRTPEGYHALVEALLATGAVLDRGMIYFDARLSASYPTVEVRVADVAQDVTHSVMVAGLARALVDTAVLEWQVGRPAPDVPAAVLRAATWRASRFGLEDELVDPLSGVCRPAASVVGRLVEHVQPALEGNGDLAQVAETVERLLAEGTGAQQQRRHYARHGRFEDVVAAAVETTSRMVG